jgi:hypothetical protein
MRPGARRLNTRKLKTLARVFSALNYDLGVLAPEERPLFSGDNAIPDWTAVDETPETRVLNRMGRQIGVVVFPGFEGRRDWPLFARELRRTIRSMRTRADLLIGISSLGWNLENQFLTGPDSGLDILLGSGPGPAFRGRLTGGAKTLWVRPYSRGRAVNTVTIPDFEATQWLSSGWKLNRNVKTGIVILKGSMTRDQTVLEIINGKDE